MNEDPYMYNGLIRRDITLNKKCKSQKNIVIPLKLKHVKLKNILFRNILINTKFSTVVISDDGIGLDRYTRELQR